jgi:hypothetical protein
VTQVNVNLSWLQRRKLRHLIGYRVAVRVNGDMDAYKWRRTVYLTGTESDINAVLIYIGYKEPIYGLLRARDVIGALCVLLALSGAASAGDREHVGLSGARNANVSEDPAGLGLGPQSWCCGKIPSDAVPRSATSAFAEAVNSMFGSVARAIKALNDRLNRTSGFDPTYGATNYNSNLGSMDPNSRGSGVTAW